MIDLSVELIEATVQIDQPISEQKRMVGTGFLVSVTRPDGTPEIVLVTAAHVFEKMPNPEVRIGWRIKTAAGNWAYAPASLTIRTAEGPLWTKHPTQDIAVIAINVPQATMENSVPISVLADEVTFSSDTIHIGDEMMTLGYPHGLSANIQGFPILRAGKIASYPVGPSSAYPTFLIDLTAVPGNSGGPVFMDSNGHSFVTGILIKQVEDSNERLELGVVADATYVRQTIAMERKNRTQVSRSVNVTPKAPNSSATESRDLIKGDTAGQVAKPSSQTGEDATLPVPASSLPEKAEPAGQIRPQ